MSFSKEKPRVGIIGSGLGGLSFAISLKKQLGFENFTIYEKESDIGGTWRDNVYPGCSSDVAGHWYCLSSEPNPYWSSLYVEQPEILAYWKRLTVKYDLRKYVVFNTRVVRATWDDAGQYWRLLLRDSKTGVEREDIVKALVNAGGGFDEPRYPTDIPGLEDFKGPNFHSARWRKDVDFLGKTVGVIGNAASGVQLIPRIAKDPTTKVINFCRTPNWFAFVGNHRYPAFVKWMFAHIPAIMWLYRFLLFVRHDAIYMIFRNENKRIRAHVQMTLTQFIKDNAPKEHLDKMIPDYPVGCRRIIVEPGYLKSLHQPNVLLNWDGIAKFYPEGIITKKGEQIPLDVVIFATGYYVAKLTTDFVGQGGLSLQEYYNMKGGATAYLGTTTPGFPNLFNVLGPNVATGHASVIFSEECQINYAIQILAPIIAGKASSFNVRHDITNKYNDWLEKRLDTSVFASCTSYYRSGVDGAGKNHAIWPGPAVLFWWKTRKVNWDHYEARGAEKWERERKRKKIMKVLLVILVTIAFGATSANPDLRTAALGLLAPIWEKAYDFASKLKAAVRS